MSMPSHKNLVRRVVLRTKLAARSKVPTLWLENEAGERWVPDLANWNGAPPGFVYQWSRFPTLLRETCLRTVEQKDVDACPHTDTKPDLGIIDSMEGSQEPRPPPCPHRLPDRRACPRAVPHHAGQAPPQPRPPGQAHQEGLQDFHDTFLAHLPEPA